MKRGAPRVSPEGEGDSPSEAWSFRAISWSFIVGNMAWATILLTIVFAVVPALIVNASVKPRARPFQIYDAAISFPLQDETVPPWASYVIPYIMYLLSVLVGEFLLCRKSHGCWTNAISVFVFFLLDSMCSFAVSNLVTEVSKKSVGFLRPYFLSACKPSPAAFPAAPLIGDHLDPMCSALDHWSTDDGRVSFPSGHSSASSVVAFYNAGYCLWTVWFRDQHSVPAVKSWGGVFVRDLLYTLALFWILLVQAMAWAIALSRVIDFRHHPADVLGGHLLGAIVAVIWVLRAVAYVRYRARFDPVTRRPVFNADAFEGNVVSGPTPMGTLPSTLPVPVVV